MRDAYGRYMSEGFDRPYAPPRLSRLTRTGVRFMLRWRIIRRCRIGPPRSWWLRLPYADFIARRDEDLSWPEWDGRYGRLRRRYTRVRGPRRPVTRKRG